MLRWRSSKAHPFNSSFLLTENDTVKLNLLAKEVKEILDRGVARDNTPEWLKPHLNGNGTGK